ncbi:hypothetical protein SAMN04489761_4559 [Tenacibaculum sp. MAR_2009_124]|uniref:hypothetical protein n=1 Tax=Tenacibaculum sp. MAR_2009_124 TaxID=1250059 RepID=UPI00089D6FBB|nr:hypothetical protein [Tenacibaculum sp. MAR_2009_124]SED18863.1 hypothetical protein SAMN04489761_4559 [Tenacibaculum sp. MAR_2009_124]
MIGGPVCNEVLSAELIFAEGQHLTHDNKEALWEIFEAIGINWSNTNYDSNNQRSSWFEMVKAKTENAPNYTGEYVNAIYVINELKSMYGKGEAYRRLLFESGINNNEPPITRIAHCKIYVVNEFIRMQVMAGGFKSWGTKYNGEEARNYHGFIAGTRYNRIAIVRNYTPETNQNQ